MNLWQRSRKILHETCWTTPAYKRSGRIEADQCWQRFKIEWLEVMKRQSRQNPSRRQFAPRSGATVGRLDFRGADRLLTPDWTFGRFSWINCRYGLRDRHRRFYCAAFEHARRIFCAQAPAFASPYRPLGRMTPGCPPGWCPGDWTARTSRLRAISGEPQRSPGKG